VLRSTCDARSAGRRTGPARSSATSAVTQTDLAAWHTDQNQPDQAAPLLEQAIATLTPLRAAPALTRAQELAHASDRITT
jgi:hypothetical protein